VRLVGADNETHLIGPGAVVPRLVCSSFAWRREPGAPVSRLLYSTADAGLETTWLQLLEDEEVVIVFHNAGFDVPVLMKAFPEHEGLWWRALERRRVACTMLREMLLNLSTSGSLEEVQLPDGTRTNVLYGLADLVGYRLGVDIKETKTDDGPRKNFGLLDGLRADQYPADFAEYASADADWALQLYEAQDEATLSESGYASLSTHGFQAATAVALTRITERGMATDAVEFERVRAWLAEELSDQKLQPLYDAGVLRRPVPPLPYARHERLARNLAGEWLGVAPEDVDWGRISDEVRQSLADSGVSFKAPVKATEDKEQAQRRVLMCQLAETEARPVESYSALGLEQLMARCEELGVRYRKTPTGAVACGKEVYEPLADAGDPVMVVYRHRANLSKMVTTELPRMTWQGELSPVVHFPFKCLVETGRTSSRSNEDYPSANGQNVDPRARPMYVPRPGFLLCSTDYSTLELCCVAQVTHELFGHSVHRDKLLEGKDLHAWLGSNIVNLLGVPKFMAAARGCRTADERYEAFMGFKKPDRPFYDEWRGFAKPVGLGFPGGIGPMKIVLLARKDYGIDMVAIAARRFETNPEEFQPTKLMLFYAKRLHRMTEETFRWTPQLKAVALAARLKEIWLLTYPEMVKYFEWVKEQRDEHNPVITQKTGDPDDPEKDSEGLCYTTPLGMHRARTLYTEAANGRAMQSPAAEGFKTALFDLVRACVDPWSRSILRGNAHVVDEIHDEVLVEVREEIAHELAMEIKAVMERGMKTVLTDVPVAAKPCLMRRWYKEADQVLDPGGRIVPWEPKEEAA